VFVPIREVAEGLCPVAFTVRLQRLDCCDMAEINSLEPRLFPRFETPFRVFDRKLRSILSAAGVMSGEFEDEVIECTPQVVANLPDQNPDTHRRHRVIRGRSLEYIGRIRVELANNGIFLSAKQILKPMPEISKMFLCPNYSFEAGIKHMRDHVIIA
jgi:hypothetical protein